MGLLFSAFEDNTLADLFWFVLAEPEYFHHDPKTTRIKSTCDPITTLEYLAQICRTSHKGLSFALALVQKAEKLQLRDHRQFQWLKTHAGLLPKVHTLFIAQKGVFGFSAAELDRVFPNLTTLCCPNMDLTMSPFHAHLNIQKFVIGATIANSMWMNECRNRYPCAKLAVICYSQNCEVTTDFPAIIPVDRHHFWHRDEAEVQTPSLIKPAVTARAAVDTRGANALRLLCRGFAMANASNDEMFCSAWRETFPHREMVSEFFAALCRNWSDRLEVLATKGAWHRLKEQLPKFYALLQIGARQVNALATDATKVTKHWSQFWIHLHTEHWRSERKSLLNMISALRVQRTATNFATPRDKLMIFARTMLVCHVLTLEDVVDTKHLLSDLITLSNYEKLRDSFVTEVSFAIAAILRLTKYTGLETLDALCYYQHERRLLFFEIVQLVLALEEDRAHKLTVCAQYILESRCFMLLGRVERDQMRYLKSYIWCDNQDIVATWNRQFATDSSLHTTANLTALVKWLGV